MHTQIARYLKLATIFPLLFFLGCVSKMALKADFGNYAEAYAKASNAQLLQNLARLANDDPVYFMQLGSISSQYQFSSSVGFNPTKVSNVGGAAQGAMPSVPTSALTLAGSLSGGVTATPIFQFLPVTGTNLVSAVMTPITDKVFYTFYDQGYPADLVARTMVATIQHDELDPISTNVFTNTIDEIITNIFIYSHRTNTLVAVSADKTNYSSSNLTFTIFFSVTNTNYYHVQRDIVSTNYQYRTNHEYFVNNPDDPTYPQFIETCANLRYAQICHMLALETIKSNILIFCNTNASLTDAVASAEAGFTVNCDNPTNGHITVVQTQQSTNLMATNIPNIEFYKKYLHGLFVRGNTNYVYDEQAPMVDLTNAFMFARDYSKGLYTFKMRTFEAALFTVAKDERYFKELNLRNARPHIAMASPYLDTNDAVYDTDEYGPFASVKHKSGGHIKIRPLMTLTYDNGEDIPRSQLTTIYYGDDQPKPYMVADVDGSSQNHTVFTMLSYLYSWTAISTQNLPVQQLIQVQ